MVTFATLIFWICFVVGIFVLDNKYSMGGSKT